MNGEQLRRPNKTQLHQYNFVIHSNCDSAIHSLFR